MLILKGRSGFERATRAVAALEFAMIAPIMALMLLAVFDITKAMIIKEEIYKAAHAIAIAASNQAVQPDKSTTLSPSAAQTSMSVIWAEMPWLRSGVENGTRLVTLTSVTFVKADSSCNPAKTTCVYNPGIAWSAYYLGGVTNGAAPKSGFMSFARPCWENAVGPDYPVDPNNEFSVIKTLNINNPDPVLVVDIIYYYTPYLPSIISKVIGSPILFEATVMWPVRSISPNANVVPYTTYNLTNLPDGGAGTKCFGYD